ncbi:type II toxin-antitoxin system mRNA interferase toxin, RelE/StbE family [Methanolobus zinderi]|jgi:YafQ family addiction module toxin component|uniref:Type II toxin-antitoxin system mRNA interferase toxin, RelE/StbE family n=1 Tax=Methanolobus zinderi TaxID=536044 RepID=A0A7D5E7G7_9EURY|nr:type II toxin-antitoxin system mRNA interferase toxin, RelE/StbE family [Methanolobus zinderi]KXS43403.1 MAG: addiction module antitoxin [Methanolobus sp. T82-4]QLC48897.1 type II toxin-antitoxin system mRNA interferase toxin, RelE/StbE family [Methanolobus zinderi]
MGYNVVVSEIADRKFMKLAKKNPKQMGIIGKKVQQIIQNPYRYKPLRGDLHGARRVHIDSSFVLIYDIDEDNKTIRILDYDHHDVIY